MGPRPVARFKGLGEANFILGGQGFCFYYMLKQTGVKRFGAQHNLGGYFPEYPPRVYRLDGTAVAYSPYPLQGNFSRACAASPSPCSTRRSACSLASAWPWYTPIRSRCLSLARFTGACWRDWSLLWSKCQCLPR